MSVPNGTLDCVEAWVVALPMSRLFKSARSRIEQRRLIVIRITAQGLQGWGEAAPVPGHTTEQLADVWTRLRSIPTVDGLGDITGLIAAAFSQANDDLQARRGNKPLWESLGGGSPVFASAAIGVTADGQPDFDQIDSAAAAGYQHAKLKISPDTEVRSISAAIAGFPEIEFGVDANATFDAGDTEVLRALDELGLGYIEQPGAVDDLSFHATLRRSLNTPIGLDESAKSDLAIEKILDSAAADIINLKAGRFGTTRTLRLAERITAAGLAVRVGGLLESGIGRAHSVSLASHPLFTTPGDIAASDRYFEDDLVRPQWRIADGLLALPSGPGIGVEVDERAVGAHAIDSLRIG